VGSGVAWLKEGVWKLRGARKGSGEGRCPQCMGEEDAKDIGAIKIYLNEKVYRKLTISED
jgi:hypothetical protein